MTRVKRGNVARNRRKKILELAKGFRGGRSKLFRPASQAVLKALTNSYRDRRRKKRDFRSLWITRINGAMFDSELSYSKFMHLLKVQDVHLNRKVLAELAYSHPETFSDIIKEVTK